MLRREIFKKITVKRISYRLDWIFFLIFPLILLSRSFLSGSYTHMLDRWANALSFLEIIIFMKPVLVIIGHPRQYKILHFRRHLGIIAFWFALFHSLWIMITRWRRNIDQYLWINNYLLWWILAMIIMLILGITTNYYSIKKLWSKRKKIQYLTYPVFFLVLIHQALMPITLKIQGYTALYEVGYIFVLFLFAKIIESMIKKRKIPSLRILMNK